MLPCRLRKHFSLLGKPTRPLCIKFLLTPPSSSSRPLGGIGNENFCPSGSRPRSFAWLRHCAGGVCGPSSPHRGPPPLASDGVRVVAARPQFVVGVARTRVRWGAAGAEALLVLHDSYGDQHCDCGRFLRGSLPTPTRRSKTFVLGWHSPRMGAARCVVGSGARAGPEAGARPRQSHPHACRVAGA